MLKTITIRCEDSVDCIEEGQDPVGYAKSLFDPVPGIDGVAATINSATMDGVDLIINVTLDVKDYLRQCVGYGMDMLFVLQDLKGQVTTEEMAELVTWLKSDPDLTVAMIGGDGDGNLDVEQYPTKPEL